MSARRLAFLTGASGFIGTNLVCALTDAGWRVINYDSVPPLKSAHQPNHRNGDILDTAALSRALQEIQPEVVIHLAARTDCRDGTTIDDYVANTQGTRHYVGDRPGPIDRWVFGFHRAIRGTEPPKLPAAMVHALALIGDGLGRLTGRPFFLTSSKLRSMTQDYPVDMAETFRVLGEPPWTLDQGIRQTVDWLKCEVWK